MEAAQTTSGKREKKKARTEAKETECVGGASSVVATTGAWWDQAAQASNLIANESGVYLPWSVLHAELVQAMGHAVYGSLTTKHQKLPMVVRIPMMRFLGDLYTTHCGGGGGRTQPKKLASLEAISAYLGPSFPLRRDFPPYGSYAKLTADSEEPMTIKWNPTKSCFEVRFYCQVFNSYNTLQWPLKFNAVPVRETEASSDAASETSSQPKQGTKRGLPED